MRSADFYTGFEGEPELCLQLHVQGEIVQTIRAWSGYFDTLMQLVPRDGDGSWSGVARVYHLHEGWYLGAPWAVENPSEFARQWDEVCTQQLEPDELQLYAQIREMIRECIRKRGDLYIAER